MSTTFARRSVALTLAAALLPVLAAAPASAKPAATPGVITYTLQNKVHVLDPDGSNPRVLPMTVAGNVTWAPDGSRFAYANGSGLHTARPDGTDDRIVTRQPAGTPAWTPDGRKIAYSDGSSIHEISVDGSVVETFYRPDPARVDANPTVAPDGTIVFEDVRNRGLYRFVPGTPAPQQIVVDGFEPDFSPDGTKLAYTLFDRAHGMTQIWITSPDGSNPVQLTNEASVGPEHSAWSADGSSVFFVQFPLGNPVTPVKKINVATHEVTPVAPQGDWVSQQPIRPNAVHRVAGQDHIDTAIAASQFNYADVNTSELRVPAKAVVLSRDDTFLDALVGSAFAARSQAPLLITPRTGLDPRIEAEIKRVLGGSGKVYLLGGPLALTPAVEDRLHAIGFTTERIAGQTHFDTAIAIDRKMLGSDTPATAIVATGTTFPDALAAGAAAGANGGTAIVLTSGDTMPASSAAYLNSLNPNPSEGTEIVTAGGPGDRALNAALAGGQLPSWPRSARHLALVGNNEKDTAVAIASNLFFPSDLNLLLFPSDLRIAAVATNRTWMDALTGGAMVGFDHGPLLITDPTGLYPGVRDFLDINSGSIDDAVLLGGPAALPEALKAPVGDAIGLRN